MRRCKVRVAGFEFALKYRDFLYELWTAIENNTGLHVKKLSWDSGDRYIATLHNGSEIPVSISADRRLA